ncbi:MAG: adenine phosphoribosyltransferase [bacterium]
MKPVERLRRAIRDVPDFPKPGILFKDITPLLGDPECLRLALDLFEERWRLERVEAVCAIESRGFILGGALADRLGAGFVPLRKPGKLPARVRRAEYALEYGTDALEIHEDALRRGQRALVVDDVLATGGTAAAACRLVTETGAAVIGAAFLVNLRFLNGAAKLPSIPHQFILEFD